MVTAPLDSAPPKNRDTSKGASWSMPAPLLLPSETVADYPDLDLWMMATSESPSSKYFDDGHPGILKPFGHVEAQPFFVPLSANSSMVLAPFDGFKGPFTTDATAPAMAMEATAASSAAFDGHQVFSVGPAGIGPSGFCVQPGWVHSPVSWESAACLPMEEEKLDPHGGRNSLPVAIAERGAVDPPMKGVPVAVFVDLSGLREKDAGGSSVAIGEWAREKRGPRAAECASGSWGNRRQRYRHR